MLPKQFRLKGNKFEKIKSKGKSLYSPVFILLHHKSSASSPQIGYIVSSRVAKKAVTRNRIKRLLREATRPHLSLLPKNKNIIVIAKKTILNKKLNTISKALEKTFNQIN